VPNVFPRENGLTRHELSYYMAGADEILVIMNALDSRGFQVPRVLSNQVQSGGSFSMAKLYSLQYGQSCIPAFRGNGINCLTGVTALSALMA